MTDFKDKSKAKNSSSEGKPSFLEWLIEGKGYSGGALADA